jgi:uncharacterized membrane protein
LSATSHTESTPHTRLRRRRAALTASVLAFALLWLGGVADQWLGLARDIHGWLASLFLSLAGLIVVLDTHERRETLTLAGVAIMGFAVEAVGVRTGSPFGQYAYTGVLQPQLLGVPVVMGFAWMALVACPPGPRPSSARSGRRRPI